MDPERARQHVPPPAIYNYTSKDVILYALGIGANTSEDLHFVYEGHPDFQVFPSFAVVPGLLANMLSDWPGIQFDLGRVLHGEQYIELFDTPFPPDGARLRSEIRVADVLDKGKGAVIISEVTTFDDRSGEKLAFQQFTVFQTGSGGFGGNRSSPAERKAPAVPETRAPDLVVEERTQTDQAALYRLGSGDLNPLHIDPNFAQMAGFQRPILHGLCSLGIACRAALYAFGHNRARALRSVKVRFAAPVEPGQTLRVEMWKNEDNERQILFQARVKETGKVVLSNGCIELKEPLGTATVAQQPPQQVAEQLPPKEKLQSAELFKAIGAELERTDQDALRSIGDALILYEITAPDGHVAGQYTVELKEGHGRVYEGQPPAGQQPTATVRVQDADFVKLVGGQLDGARKHEEGGEDSGGGGVGEKDENGGGGGLLGWLWLGRRLRRLLMHHTAED